MIKHKDSHMDHGFSQAQWDHIFATLGEKSGLFIETLELPAELGTVTNELYGPSAGDSPVADAQVFYAPRGTRAWDSRLIKMPLRPTRFVRVIAGPHEEKCSNCFGTGSTYSLSMMVQFGASQDEKYPCRQCVNGIVKFDCILYTAYGVASKDMPAAPKEPGDLEAQANAASAAWHEARGKWRDAGSPENGPLREASAEAFAKLDKLIEARRESISFWSEHALATEAE